MKLYRSSQERRLRMRLIEENAYPGVIKPYWYWPLKEEMENPTGQRSLSRAQAYVRRQQNKIEQLTLKGKVGDAVLLASRLYHSKAAMLHASNLALRAAVRKIRNNKQLSDTQKEERISRLPRLGAIIASLDDHSIDPPVLLDYRPKKSGGYRKTYTFAVCDRARQHRVALTYGRIVKFDDAQSGVRGRSYLRAQDDAARLIMDQRYEFACELDFENYYLSVTGSDVLRHFPIPERIVDEVISLKGKEKRKRIKTNHKNANTQHDKDQERGCLPPGSAVSPVFAYGILQPALKRFRTEWNGVAALINANDNFLLLAPDRETMQRAINSLRALISELAAETLTLKQKSPIRHVSNGITFLGQRFRRRPGASVRSIPAKIKTAIIEEFRKRLLEVERYARSDRPVALDQWHRTLKWLLAKLRPHTGARSDWEETASSLLTRLRVFAEKYCLRTEEWTLFASTVRAGLPSQGQRLANICPGEPTKWRERFAARLEIGREQKRRLRRVLINSVRSRFGADSVQMQRLAILLT